MVYMKRALSQAESNAEKLAPKIEDALVEPKNGTDHQNIDIQARLFTYLWTSCKCPRADIAATISRVKRKPAIVGAAHFTEAKK